MRAEPNHLPSTRRDDVTLTLDLADYLPKDTPLFDEEEEESDRPRFMMQTDSERQQIEKNIMIAREFNEWRQFKQEMEKKQ